MSSLVQNLFYLVVLPSLVVTAFAYATLRLLDFWMSDCTPSRVWTAAVVSALGVYFLGHPLIPGLVPLIRASTPWMYAVGTTYLVVGTTSVVWSRYRQFSAVGSWLVAILSGAIAVLAANGFDPGAVVDFLGSNDIGPSLYLSLPLVFQFPLGYDYHLATRKQMALPFVFVFASYVLVLANSIPLVEPVRGPVGIVFVAFGWIGVLLGTPLYALGVALGSSPNER